MRRDLDRDESIEESCEMLEYTEDLFYKQAHVAQFGQKSYDEQANERRINILEGLKQFPGIPNVPRSLRAILKRNREAHPDKTDHDIIDLTIMQLKMGVDPRE